MNLIVDIGNTRVKVALFKGDDIIEFNALEYEEALSYVKLLDEKYNISSSIISNVGSPLNELELFLETKYHHIKLDSETPLPVKINYDTPETLGVDRRALAVAAFELSGGKPSLVIDMGSCITYDLVNSSAIYQGGAISPGVNMRFKSMHNFTQSLPLVSMKDSDSPIGKNTEMSLVNGVLFGVKGEIDSYIDEIRASYSDILIFISGGDHPFFVNKLKNSIFADSKMLLKGLNRILKYNIKEIDE